VRIEKLDIRVALLMGSAAVALAMFAGSAKSAVWTFNSCSGSGVNTICTAGSLVARGVSSTGSGGTIAQAKVAYYSGNGLGVTAAGEPTGSPSHSTDNSGTVDAILLNFGQIVNLDSITIGWSQTDSDISLFRYTGSGNPWTNGDLLGETYGSLGANNWALVGNYANLVVNSARAVNAGNAASQYWLLSAYTSAAGGGCIATNGYVCDNGDDYFKLKTVTGSTVPEPGTVALLGVVSLSALALRRRRRH